MRFDVLTIFPEMFSSVVGTSILRRAISGGKVEFILHDIRQYAPDKHRTVDGVPYGGGAGMVMKAEPIINAVNDVEAVGGSRLRIFLTPQGEPLTQSLAKELASFRQLVIVCGHYEGVDQRARDLVIDREISIGDYVLTGGELPALVIAEVVSRLIPGVLGNSESHLDESFANPVLEYPHYTRPASCLSRKVPEVLLSGNHKEILKWRNEQSCLKTKMVRPDLL